MNKFKHIQEQIASLPPDFKVEEIKLDKAFNRVLQEDVVADTNMPPFDKSAMDGYACRLEDLENELEVLEVIYAGMVPAKKIYENKCSKIMTGAKVPEGADCIFMVEDSETIGENSVRCVKNETNINICYRGEDYKKGDILIEKGTIINISQMGVLAGAGYHKLKVSVTPKVGLITTGTELVEPNQELPEGKIRNSNASQIISQIQKMSLEVTNYGIIEDDYDKLTATFSRALQENDFVIFTGGASVGDADWIPKIIDEQNFKVYWNRTGIRPGNPMTFSQKKDKYCFGLAGNPVSAMVQFDVFIKPVVYKLLGANYKPFRIKATIDFNYSRKNTAHLQIVPVVINAKGLVEQIPYNGPAHINTMVFANAIMEVPLGQSIINKGETVYVRSL